MLSAATLTEIVPAAAQLMGHSLERVVRLALPGYPAQKVIRPSRAISHDAHLPARG